MTEPTSDQEQLLTKVAWLYYVDNLTQQEIAERLHLSRPKVGRLLQAALASGIVEIRLADNVSANVKLSRELEDRLGVSEVIVVEGNGDDAFDRRQVGKAAAMYLQRLLHGKFILGVGIGLTVNEVIPFIRPSRDFSEGTIIGISGGFSYPEISSIEMSGRLAEKLGARAENIFAPFIVDHATARSILHEDRNVKAQLEKAARSTIVVTGVGAYTENNHFYRLGYIDQALHEHLINHQVAGEIMARFYDIQGRHIPNDLDSRMIGLDLGQLKNIPTVIGLASNAIKAPAIIGGVRSGALNVLVLDDRLARRVIELDDELSRKKLIFEKENTGKVKPKLFDLHMHSTASDGTLSPTEMVNMAAERGLIAMAITDHDTVGGIEEGAAAAQKAGIEFFHGVELNTDASELEIDILGYFINLNDPDFLKLVKYREQERIRRAKGMVEKLIHLGCAIEYDRVREIARGVVARPHIAQALIEKGYATNQKDAYDRYIGYGKVAYVERDPLLPQDAIKEIKRAGGLPIIAHPGLIGDDNMVRTLLEAGAEGLEAYYAYHTPEQVQKYLQFAQEYGVITGCGSDYHGPGRHKSQPMGGVIAPIEVLDIFRQKVQEHWQQSQVTK
jgi:DNA-binding transcriptional regulator LsrR (DeoR family)/predicted metal-dependent phosphoesterase TrpH